MPSITIEGGKPLLGTVDVTGSKYSTLKLIYTSMFSNEDILLENVPDVLEVIQEQEIIKSIGGVVNKVGNDKLILNGSSINTYKVPMIDGYNYSNAILLAGPLLFRFGKAIIPKGNQALYKPNPINRIVNAWKALGIEIEEDDESYKLTAQSLHGGQINFKTTTHLGTDSAIISALFINEETIISNASEELEVDDLITFCNLIGASVTRQDSKRIRVVGTNIFRGGNFELQSDKVSAAAYASAAVLTGGDVIIRKTNKVALTPLTHFLSSIGVNYEFFGNEFKVWANEGNYKTSKLTVSPSPGFTAPWKPYATLLLTQAIGESTIHDTVYTNRFDYVKDLNRMGSKIELVKPSEVGIMPVISDDSYDFEAMGEPLTVAKIIGPSKLKGQRINITDAKYIDIFVIAALGADGKSELLNCSPQDIGIEHFIDNLINLGASIKY